MRVIEQKTKHVSDTLQLAELAAKNPTEINKIDLVREEFVKKTNGIQGFFVASALLSAILLIAFLVCSCFWSEGDASPWIIWTVLALTIAPTMSLGVILLNVYRVALRNATQLENGLAAAITTAKKLELVSITPASPLANGATSQEISVIPGQLPTVATNKN